MIRCHTSTHLVQKESRYHNALTARIVAKNLCSKPKETKMSYFPCWLDTMFLFHRANSISIQQVGERRYLIASSIQYPEHYLIDTLY